jgi:hypothetical protein
LLEEVSRDTEDASLTKQNLLIFPDETLSAMQVEAIKKRNAILGKYQLQILELNEEIVALEGEVKKLQIIETDKN